MQPIPFLSGEPCFSSHELEKPAQFFQSAWSVYASQTLSTGALKCLLTSMCCIGAASPLPLRCRPARRHRDERGNALHVVAVARPARGAALVEQRYADEH